MKINLTKSVPLKEFCRIKAVSNINDIADCIEFTFSHEAIVGFATNLLWIYDDIVDSRKMTICTNQLKVDPCPSQSVGFYLTPSSPVLMLKINQIDYNNGDSVYNNYKEIYIRNKDTNYYYNISGCDDGENITIETYEMLKKNVVNLKIFNNKGDDITTSFNTVILELNRNGMKDLATMLLVWASNYKEGDRYDLPHIDNVENGYNLGIVLDKDSVSTVFCGKNLGTAGDYDSRMQ